MQVQNLVNLDVPEDAEAHLDQMFNKGLLEHLVQRMVLVIDNFDGLASKGNKVPSIAWVTSLDKSTYNKLRTV